MSNFKLDYSSFERFADDIDERATKFWFSHNPLGISCSLRDRIKFGAKILANACNIQRSRALECFAGALLFHNWHSLSVHLNRASDFPKHAAPDNWVEPLKYTLVLLIVDDTEIALQPNQITAFEDFATRLSQEASCPVELVLDTVCAGFCGGADWAAVKSRKTLNATSPLYQFEIDHLAPGTGRFTLSRACEHLISELDDYYQGEKTPEELQVAEKWIKSALVSNPTS